MPWFYCSSRHSIIPFRSSGFRLSGFRFLCRSALATASVFIGCASPGPPRAPSLGLPQPVRDLTVIRIDNTVELRFDAPSRSTDKILLRGGTVTGQICRQLEHQPCLPVPSSRQTVATSNAEGKPNLVTWTDTLPPELADGSPRLLGYRVEFFSQSGRSAGFSAPAFTAAGVAPAPVEGIHADGSRLGVVLGWNPSAQAGEVILRREDLAPAPPVHPVRASEKAAKKPAHAPAPSVVWLGTREAAANNTAGNGRSTDRMLDTTARPDTPYRYSAQRRTILQIAGKSIELRSSLSTPVSFTLREIYPPAAPSGLTAAGYFANSPAPGESLPSAFAVDLIWQPVNDAGLLAGLAGYNIYREPLAASGQPTTPRSRLNSTPILTPSFHDSTANPAARYRYSVTAIDQKGNESAADTVLLGPSAAQ